MTHTYEELKKKTVAELRKIAADIEHEELKGYTQMNKEHLLKAICKALGIDMYEHHVAKDEHKTEIKAANSRSRLGWKKGHDFSQTPCQKNWYANHGGSGDVGIRAFSSAFFQIPFIDWRHAQIIA